MKIDKFTSEPYILRELAERIARIRKAQGFSQTELAREAGIGVATLRRIEGGQDCHIETWIKLLKALNMASTIDALLPETFNSPMAETLAKKSRKHRKSTRVSGPVWGDQVE